MKCRIQVYNSLILPHFEYASTIWSNTCPTYTEPLRKLQARAGRVILGVPRDTPSDQVIRDLNWIPMADRWNCQRAVMMYKIMNGMVPRYLSDGFVPLSQSYGEGGPRTRGQASGNLQVMDKTANDWARRRLVTHGVFLWNGLPPNVKNSKSLTSFKSSVKNLAKRSHKFYSLY